MIRDRRFLDERDREILAQRSASLARNPINVGDFVTFKDGTTRRVSYVWTSAKCDKCGLDEHRLTGCDGTLRSCPESIQTSAGGSFYLGNGYVSFSGALNHGVPFETLIDTGDTHDGEVWFFSHDFAMADNGVHAMAKFRVWHCDRIEAFKAAQRRSL